MADGKVVISTALDNKGIEKDAQKMHGSIKSQVMKLAHEYKKQGMSMSDAMKKAYAELGVAGKQASEQVGKSIQSGIGGSASIAVGKLGGLAKVVAGVTATITAAFGAAAIAITKQAVDAYADYDQLIGGVKTLFKDSADKVADYAEDAFYTVGLSANEYMEVVTSFSASLISALGGDTAQAADVANMALVDMADNANKMGSSMESVQNAYQGFAKQNYTMLDNLKLGYGGTKTEMERLLADAQKLTGVKYNINNLADVYNAIHAIQVEMGIAGTTAKEAEKTITGSANMTKAAWKNVLTAISGGGDIDKAINNLVYSVSKYFDNIAPVVERALAGIGELIEKIAPQLVQTVATALIKAIPSLLNAVYQMLIGLVRGVYEGIAALFSGSTKEITAQINATEELADGFGGAAKGASDLADATEKAGKAAKKSLTPFDEISKLSNKDSNGGDAGFAPTVSAGGASGIASSNTAKGVNATSSAFSKLSKVFEPLKKISFSGLKGSLKSLLDALKPFGKLSLNVFRFLMEDILFPLAKWSAEDLLPAFLDAVSAALEAAGAIIEAVQPTLDWLWNDIIVPMGEFVGDLFIEFLDMLTTVFSNFSSWASENQETVNQMFQLVLGFLAGVWIYNTVKNLITFLSNLGTAFSNFGTLLAEGGLKGAFMAASIGILAAGIIALAQNWNKMSPAERVITILGALAAAATAAAIAIGIFHTAWSVGVAAAAIAGGLALLGLSFAFSDTGDTGDAAQDAADSFYSSYDWNRTISVPALAKGTVLPPNKPFLAVVGDQTHGTNIEAPLSTIEEAVANVMGDMLPAMVAGFERVIEEQQATRRAVESIEVGDTTIGEAANRHNTKIAIITGGA